MKRNYYAIVWGRYGRSWWDGGAPAEPEVVVAFQSRRERDEFCRGGASYPHERGYREPISAQEVRRWRLPVLQASEWDAIEDEPDWVRRSYIDVHARPLQ